jgi:predicted signal transduction protein with EAL and GGDEF domain
VQGLAAGGEIQAVTRSGQQVWVLVDIQPLRDSSNRVLSWVVVASNIDDVVRSRLQRRALFEALPTGVLVHARGGEVTDANAAALEMMGLPPDHMEKGGDIGVVHKALAGLGRAVRDDLTELQTTELPVVRCLRDCESVRNELVGYQRASGGVSWTLVNAEPLLDEQGSLQGAVVCVVDVTAQKQLEQKLRDNARTDSLTSLPNRLVVTDQISAALRRHQQHAGYHFAVLFMDFDRFK